MLKGLRNVRGQSVSGEYVMVFFLALGAIAAMTIFSQRALQGHIRDARIAMVDIVRNYPNGYQGALYYEYEPYYTNTVSEMDRRSFIQSGLVDGGASGISHQIINEATSLESQSETAPPRMAY